MSVYLTVTAHPDDEILGFGASSYVLSQKGHTIYNCILSGAAEARVNRPGLPEFAIHIATAQQIVGAQPAILGDFPNIQFNTVPHLHMVQFIERVIEQVQPDYIFTHHPSDLNADHGATSAACQAAARLFQRKEGVNPLKGLYFMEILSSTDWAFPSNVSAFQPNTFIQIGEEGIAKKEASLSEYVGVMRSYPHPRSSEVLRSLALLRGAQSGLNYAEAFQCVFQTLEV